MSMNICDFVKEKQMRLIEFYDWWRTNQQSNPKLFPYVLDNFDEQFECYLDSRFPSRHRNLLNKLEIKYDRD